MVKVFDEHGCCICDTRAAETTKNMNLSDDPALRDRHPMVSAMLHDSEIAYLIMSPEDFKPRIDVRFRYTGAIVLPRDGDLFRKKFLETYEAARYKKVQLKDFRQLARGHLFDKDAKYQHGFPWEDNAPDCIVFRSILDMWVLVPETWEKEIETILRYARRKACIKNGYVGRYDEQGNNVRLVSIFDREAKKPMEYFNIEQFWITEE